MDWSIPDDYWRTTWHHWLPLGPWMMLAMAVGTATHHDIDGSLQQIVDTISGQEGAELPHCGPLTGPLRWNDSDDPEDAAAGEERKQAFADVLTRAGHSMPATTQELADLLVELGVLTHTQDPERWRIALPMPMVSNTLPIPEEDQAREQWVRDFRDYQHANQAVLRWIKKHVPDQETVGQTPTTLRQLAADCALTLEETRRGLALMVDEPDVVILRHESPLNPEQIFALKDHQRFQIQLDWDKHAESRILIRAAPSEENMQEA